MCAERDLARAHLCGASRARSRLRLRRSRRGRSGRRPRARSSSGREPDQPRPGVHSDPRSPVFPLVIETHRATIQGGLYPGWTVMRKLIYSTGVSLGGFIAGPQGEIDWSAPDEELHRFHNEQTRELGAHLCGRGLYETMVFWESAERDPAAADFILEF